MCVWHETRKITLVLSQYKTGQKVYRQWKQTLHFDTAQIMEQTIAEWMKWISVYSRLVCFIFFVFVLCCLRFDFAAWVFSLRFVLCKCVWVYACVALLLLAQPQPQLMCYHRKIIVTAIHRMPMHTETLAKRKRKERNLITTIGITLNSAAIQMNE